MKKFIILSFSLLFFLPLTSWAQRCVNNPPTNFSMTETNPTTITLTWDADPNAEYYLLYWREHGDAWSIENLTTVGHTITNLTPGALHYAMVRGKCSTFTRFTAVSSLTLSTGSGPCDSAGGDVDGDGVCADDDCDDNNSSVGAAQLAGTRCNDGDANTINDVIQADGCTCEGTVPAGPCDSAGGDADGDGVCADDDCDDNDASVGASQTAGTSCNDGDANTTGDVIQADGCTCAGTVPDACANAGGDADNDGVCADDDCDDNDASVGASQTAGTSCNDGNANTTGDVIQADGCTCAGTTTTTPPATGPSLFTEGTGMIYRDGKVVVGAANTAIPGDYNLYVTDGILTEKVKVALQSGDWSDFVFEEGYDRNSIAFVEEFIQKNKHLPNVPSAKEIGENGVDLGQMDAILLRQIEELWLHVIDLKKANEALKKKVLELEK